MMRGSTDSDEEVPNTISSSSLMYLINFQMPKPATCATGPSTRKTKRRQAA